MQHVNSQAKLLSQSTALHTHILHVTSTLTYNEQTLFLDGDTFSSVQLIYHETLPY